MTQITAQSLREITNEFHSKDKVEKRVNEKIEHILGKCAIKARIGQESFEITNHFPEYLLYNEMSEEEKLLKQKLEELGFTLDMEETGVWVEW